MILRVMQPLPRKVWFNLLLLVLVAAGITMFFWDTRRAAELAEQQREEAASERRKTIQVAREQQDLQRLRANLGVNRTAEASGTNEPTIRYEDWPSDMLANALRKGWEEDPSLGIGEMEFLDEGAWLRAAQMMINNPNGYSDAELLSRAYRYLRNNSRGAFTGILRPALDDYLAASGGVLPPNMEALTPFFSKPVSLSILERYRVLRTGSVESLGASTALISEVTGWLDHPTDGVMTIMKTGGSIAVVAGPELRVYQAVNLYASEHAGVYPTAGELLARFPDFAEADVNAFVDRFGSSNRPNSVQKGTP